MARLFVAVWLPDDVRSGSPPCPERTSRACAGCHPHQWHVTLRFLGEADPVDAAAALGRLRRDVVEAGSARRSAVWVARVVCLPVEGLEGLAASVAYVTADIGQPPDPRPFNGHVTMARLRRRGAVSVGRPPLRQPRFASPRSPWCDR